LSRAELDRMLEGDSTANFEQLETRLKAPARRKKEQIVADALPDDCAQKVPASADAEANDGSQKDRSDDVSVDMDQNEDGEVSEVEGVAALQRSVSMVNLKDLVEEEAGMETTLTRSASDTDLATEPASNFLLEALEAKKHYAEQQAAIDAEMLRLIEESRLRRERFKLCWGVSPKSVNRKRTLKTVIVCPEIKMDQMTEPELEQDVAESPLAEVDQLSLDAIFAADASKEGDDDQHDDLLSSRNIEWFSEVFDEDDELDLANAEEVVEEEDVHSEAMEITQVANEDPKENVQPEACQNECDDIGKVALTQQIEVKKQKKKSVVRFAATPSRSPADCSSSSLEEREALIKVRTKRGHCERILLSFVFFQINVPIRIGGRAGNISFTERRRSQNVCLHTPTPRHPKATSRTGHQQTVVSAATPAALKGISNRAQEALALLYNDNDGGHEVSFKAKGRMNFDNFV